MRENFITKLETEKYLIGSFDAYLDKSKELIQNNSHLSEDDTDDILKSMSTVYRATILNKNGEYVGYIGLFNVDAENHSSSIRFETKKDLTEKDKCEILEEFKKYMFESLNLTDIGEFIYKSNHSIEFMKNEIIPKSNIIVPSKLLEPGISPENIEKFSKDYSIPRLQMPFTIKSSDRVIGIVGLSNVIWSNKRANLNIFLDKSLGSDISKELSGYIIDDYINYVHKSNIHNVTLSVNGSNNDMINILNNTSMNYYGQIPFSVVTDENIESNLMFQHIPFMEKSNEIIIPDNKKILSSLLETEKKEMADCIELDNGYRLVSPKSFEKENIDFNKILEGHVNAMKNREGFAIPLGEDKYIMQKGNGNYGISKAVMNYSYIVLNENNDYSGYINVLRTNGTNVEIEIGIDPKIQHKGLGSKVINKFYDELFSIGYASVTSAVFEFNKPSLKLHEKVAELNGIRLDSYYINGELWDMNFYTKINDKITEKETNLKHI